VTRSQFDRYVRQALGPPNSTGLFVEVLDETTVYFSVPTYHWDDVRTADRHYLSWAPGPGDAGDLYYLVGPWDSESGAHEPDVKGLGMEGLSQWEGRLRRPVFDECGLDILLP
jgi:hypothetical protein